MRWGFHRFRVEMIQQCADIYEPQQALDPKQREKQTRKIQKKK